MAEVVLQIRGVLYDLQQKTSQQVVLQGAASLLGLGVGGGPIMPPEGGGGSPPGIWGGGNEGFPTPPIHLPPTGGGGGRPPGIWGGGNEGFPTPPIHLPPPITPVPPDTPNVPPPGSPPAIIAGTQPVNPMTPPSAVVMEYPGIGKVLVPQPTATVQPPPGTPTQPTPPAPGQQ